jgi:hypothetical protein
VEPVVTTALDSAVLVAAIADDAGVTLTVNGVSLVTMIAAAQLAKPRIVPLAVGALTELRNMWLQERFKRNNYFHRTRL